MDPKPNLRPDAFAGAAAAYARYRPPYPKQVLSDLLAASPSNGAVLDLACGPGRLALDLAASVQTVWAIDMEPEMIEVGTRVAAGRGLDNITWFVGRAEDLAAPQEAFDLITIGEAFHRLDRPLVARQALGWLKPGGCLATLGCEGILAGQEPWQKTVAEVAHRWMAKAFPGGWGVARDGVEVGPGSEARALRAAGFVEVTEHAFHEPRDWTFEEIAGYLRSTSVCSEKALGGDFAAFEAELRAALRGPAEAQTFHETTTWGYTLGQKPR